MQKRTRHFIRLSFMVATAMLLFQCASKKGTDRETSGETAQVQDALNHIFKGGEEGYKCYRIPAVVRTEKGTLLAFAEGRKGGCSDTGDIDLLLKRSEDDGKTWGSLQVVWDDSANTCGNPAPVVDRETGEIFLLSTWNLGADHEKEIIKSESEDTRRVFVTSSADDGRTWGQMRDITESVKRAEWTWYATGPCSGIQLTHERYKGRMVIPCDHIVAGSIVSNSHIIYSDDHGKTWQLGGISPLEQTNESTVAELSNGDLMLNMRNYDREKRHRQVAISSDGGATWKNVYADSTLVEPICQASLISHTFSGVGAPGVDAPGVDSPGKDFHYLVFSNPASKKKRVNQTVRLSRDDGKTWFVSKTIHKGPTAYSCLVSLPEGNIGVLYEAGWKKPYEGIAFKILTPQDLFDQ